MIKLGLTGGIGSGKSTIAKIFSVLGVPVYNSDIEAKNLYQTDQILKTQIISAFGENTYSDLGEINKSYLISFVFSDNEKLKLLNSIVHPRVKLNFEQWILIHADSKLILKEAAILFESGAYKQVDKTIVVSAPDEIRIERVMKRDLISRSGVLDRMKHQWAQNDLIAKADFVIDNSGRTSVIKQVLQLYKYLIQ
jgi:dephospho-CoA kinase